MAVDAVSDHGEERVDEAMEAATTLQQVAVAFAALSDDARDVVMLVGVEGLTYAREVLVMVDELELVRHIFGFDPVSDSSTHRRSIRDRVLAEIETAEPMVPGTVLASSPRNSRRRRRRTTIAVLTLPVVGALAAAGWAIAERQASQVTESIGCFASPDVHGSINIVGSSGASPVSVCSAEWRDGIIAGPVGTVPPLTACVLPRGNAIGVFPDATCARLGLQPLPPGYAAAATNFAALRDQLVRELGDSGQTTCVSESRADIDVREALRSFGYSSWKVSAQQFSSFTPCAGFSPDPQDHQIIIVGTETPAFNNALNSATEAQRATCAVGASPEPPSTALRLFTRALRAAGYGYFKVVVDPVVTTRQQPCYEVAVDPHGVVHLSGPMEMNPLPDGN